MMDMRIVNEEGMYSLRSYDLRRFQDIAGRAMTDEDAMMKWFGIPFKTGSEFVRACREIGIESGFTRRESSLVAGAEPKRAVR
jgi:hypothetical protein